MNLKIDFVIIFITRMIRMFTYGMISLVFLQNLHGKKLTNQQISILQLSILTGDIILSFFLTTNADKIGRKNTLIVGALLKLISGVTYSLSQNFYVLIIAGIVGVITVTGGQIGPFLPIQQSILAQIIEKQIPQRHQVEINISKYYGYFNLVGYLSLAFGALFAGFFISLAHNLYQLDQSKSSNYLILLNGLLGLLMCFCYYLLRKQHVQTTQIENLQLKKQKGQIFNIKGKNVKKVFFLSFLFAIDAFAAGFIAHSFISYFLQKRFELQYEFVGSVLSLCSIISAISSLLSTKLVKKIGCIATMIYTHLPSNLFLLAIPFASSPNMAIILLFCRFTISQMDVPARQTFVSLLVSSKQRSAANGITNIARSIGLSIGITINSFFLNYDGADFIFGVPFIISGGFQIIYDIVLALCFMKSDKKNWNIKKQMPAKIGLLSQQLGQL